MLSSFISHVACAGMICSTHIAFGVVYKSPSEEEDSKSESSDVESDESWEHQADK